MMKLNKKGFMMAEVIVVSAVVLMTLSTLFVSYNKIYSLYNTRLKYTEVSTFYRLAYYRDKIMDGKESIYNIDPDFGKNKRVLDLSNNSLCGVDECKDKILLVYNGKKQLNIKLNYGEINPTFKDYIDYLTDAVDLTNTRYVMLLEHCDSNNDNCKYSYINLYDECDEKNYEIDGNYYCTLSSAFKAAVTGDTIETLCNNVEKVDAVLDKDKKEIKLDLHGNEINMEENTLINYGELEIYSSNNSKSDTCSRRSLGGNGARIQGNNPNKYVGVIRNYGTLETNKSYKNEIEFVNYVADENLKKLSPTILVNDIILKKNVAGNEINEVDSKGSVVLNKNTKVRFNNPLDLPGDILDQSSHRYMIVNSGELTLDGAELKNTYECVINKEDDEKNCAHDAGILIGKDMAKDDNSIFYGLTNGNVTVKGDTKINTYGFAINNYYGGITGEKSKITIMDNSEISSSIMSTLYSANTGGEINIESGNIKFGEDRNNIEIKNKGVLSEQFRVAIFYYEGKNLNITGGNINSNGSEAIYLRGEGVSAKIQKGAIKANNIGIKIGSSSNNWELVLGNNDETVEDIPKIESVNSGIYVVTVDEEKIEFYDGIISSKTAIYGIDEKNIKTPNGYSVSTTKDDGIETAKLKNN